MQNLSSLLSKEKIKEMFTSLIFQRGQFYYQQGRVLNLRYDRDEEIWTAKVNGNDIYDVAVDMKYGTIRTICDCASYDNYFQCKHGVAVLLEILDIEKVQNKSKRQELLARNYAYDKTARMIDSFSQDQPMTTTPVTDNPNDLKKPMLLEFRLKANSIFDLSDEYYLTLELRAGVQHLYVVKNMVEFLEAIESQSTYQFTKRFMYDPTEHYFLQEDYDLIKLLLALVQNERVYVNAYTEQWNRGTTNRTLILPPILIDEILTRIKERAVQFEYADHSEEKFDVVENMNIPLIFDLRKGESGDFKLNIAELQNAIYFETYGYLYFKNVFYKLTLNQQRYAKGLFSILKKDKDSYLSIRKDQIEPFLSQVKPVLEKIGSLTIDDSISNQIIAPPLEARAFIGYRQNSLQVELEYHYGDRIIHPFQTKKINENPDPIIIMRDKEKEQEIMNVLETTSLRYNGKELFLEEEEDIYDFIYSTLPMLEDKMDIFLTNTAKELLLPNQHQPVVSMDMDSSGSWLEFNFNIDGIQDTDVQNILRSVIEKKRYYRLPNGTFVPIDNHLEEFNLIRKIINELDIKKSEVTGSEIRRPIFKGLRIDEVLGDHNKHVVRIGKAFKRLIQNLKNPENLDFAVPSSLNATLRDYQIYGYQWMKTLAYYHLGGILADDMGLGKTIQSIAFIISEKDEHKSDSPVLIVSPASLVYNWRNEFQKFAPHLNIMVADGTPEERKERFSTSNDVDVWITSYPLVRQDIDYYKEMAFSTLILDEAQAIKNPATKIFKAVLKLKAINRFALSGTPIENSIDELWSIFQAILPGLLPNKIKFHSLTHEHISKLVRPFILRRVKKDVLKELPDKIETVQISELTKEQKELYIGYLEKIQNETIAAIQSEGFEKSRIKILAGLTRLRQLCNHPSLFLDNYTGESGKLEQLIELVKTTIANGQRPLIFSQFSSMLKIIRERLNLEGYSNFYLDGQTPAKDRVHMVDQFNQGINDIFLISLKAGGTGLNLTGADTVILFDLWWNPAVEDQAAGRAHRIGQKKVVHVIRLISQGTIEEKIHDMQLRKRELIEKVIQPGEQLLSRMTEKELMEILSM